MLSKNIILGAIIALVVPIIGFVFWVEYLTKYEISQAIDLMIKGSLYSEILSLSAISNLPVFLFLMNRKKYDTARGILLMTILFSFVVIILKLI